MTFTLQPSKFLTMPTLPAPSSPSIYLGFDMSTQSLSVVALSFPYLSTLLSELESGLPPSNLSTSKVIYSYSCNYATILGTDGVTSSPGGVCSQDVSVYLKALDHVMSTMWKDAVMSRMMKHVKAVGGCAQQHGAVYWGEGWEGAIRGVDEEGRRRGSVEKGNNKDNKDDKDVNPPLLYTSLLSQSSVFSKTSCSIWMDSSTSDLCTRLNSDPTLSSIVRETGTSFTSRFTGPQISLFASTSPTLYAETLKIHLISTFLSTLFLGSPSPYSDPSDSGGMNLLSLKTGEYTPELLALYDPTGQLPDKLVPICKQGAVLGEKD